MKITDVRVEIVRIPLKEPKRFAAKTVYFRDYIIAHVDTDEGISGWGFCWGLPVVGKIVTDYFRDLLIGASPFDRALLWHKMYKSMAVLDRGGISYRAISIIDIALWDIAGKAAGLPIHQLMGSYREKTPAYYSGGYNPVSCETESALFAYMEKEFSGYYDKGFRAFKMKIGALPPDVEMKRVALVRKIVGDDSQLMVDANNSWDLITAINMARRLEEFNVAWIEEPVAMDDLKSCAKVAASTTIPIAIGESHFARWAFREIIESGAGEYLQGDPTVMGGFTEWLNLAGLAATYGMPLAPHCPHDINVQICSARPEVTVMEYFDLDSDVFTIQAVFENPVAAENGFVSSPSGAGHGLILNEEAVKRYRLE